MEFRGKAQIVEESRALFSRNFATYDPWLPVPASADVQPSHNPRDQRCALDSNSTSSTQVRAAATAEVIPLRHAVLRVGLPRSTAFFDGDDEPTTRHFVAETDGRVVGCVTILHRPWEGSPAWQLRGMAVADEFRGQGIGQKLLAAVEAFVRSSDYSRELWCNARVAAVRFYQQSGWVVVSQEFEIPSAGLHKKMKWSAC